MFYRFIRLPQVSEIMNMHLPPQVRVFSCVKVNNGFQAREACSWRAYEYILPLELLADSDNLVCFNLFQIRVILVIVYWVCLDRALTHTRMLLC